MEQIKLKGKRGAVGATLTWIVAIFIVFFILVLFIIASFAVSLKKERIEITKKELPGRTDFISTQILSFILNTKIEVDGKQMTTKEAIKKLVDIEDGEDAEEFKENIERQIKGKLDEYSKAYIFKTGLDYDPSIPWAGIRQAKFIEDRTLYIVSDDLKKDSYEMNYILRKINPAIILIPLEKEEIEKIDIKLYIK